MKKNSVVVCFLFLVFFFFLGWLLSGCAGNCLSLEGAYKEYAGGMTWCFDQSKSVESGKIVLNNNDGKIILGLSEDDVDVINAELTPVSASGRGLIPPWKILIEKIERLKIEKGEKNQ